jgi:hypothetical protein
MAANEEADHHLLDYFFLANDYAAYLRHDLALYLSKAINARSQYFGLQLLRHC